MGAIRASSGTVHLLTEELHNTSPRRGHPVAEFDSTNAVAQLTSRGQLLHLNSIRCSVSSFARIHSSVFCYYLGVGRSLYLVKPLGFIRLAVGSSTPLTA